MTITEWWGEMAHDPRGGTDGNENYVVAAWQPTVRIAVLKSAQATVLGSGTFIPPLTTSPTSILNPATPTIAPGYLGRPFENGWWPSLSPGGRYISFGNGGSWVYNFQTKILYDLKANISPALFAGTSCYGGKWLSNTLISVWCIDDAENRYGNWLRYEARVGEWIP